MALSKFGTAFAAARKAGKSTFDFNGKKYTTEMAKPTAKPASKPMSTADKASMATKMLGDAPAGTSQYAKQKLRDLASGLQTQATNEARMKAYGPRSAGEAKRVPVTRKSNTEVAGPVVSARPPIKPTMQRKSNREVSGPVEDVGMKCGGKVKKKR